MVFTSSIFLNVFLPLTLVLYYIAPSRKVKNMVLFVFSIVFYAWGEPKYVLLMLLSIIMNWFLGLAIAYLKNRKRIYAKCCLALAVTLNLMILFHFKYLNFVINSICAVTKWNFDVKQLVLPIGISFFTFQAISYVIDIYRGNGDAQKNPTNVGLYIAFFPQLIAGPIVRYETISEQMNHRKESLEKFSEGVLIFVRGFCKKILLANNMAIVADRAFQTSDSELSVAFAWLGALAYTFQIFFDFSGYSEMAIGLGKMFGFDLLPNFYYPYISKSVSEFWRRWHISLGTWFRDYVYFPLGGSRVKHKGRLVFNLFVVWLLTGIWHGANWTFIIWGLMYFVLITVEKLTGFEKKGKNIFLLLSKFLYTSLFVVIGWVLFRADNLSHAIKYVKAMFGFGPEVKLFDYLARFYAMEYGIFFLFCAICSVPIMEYFKRTKFSRYENIKYIVYSLLFIISLTYIAKGSYNPFIYFNF